MIYLNNGATSFPKPQCVIDAVNDCLLVPAHHGVRTGFKADIGDHVYQCRVALAKLFNVANPMQIVLGSGSTEALNLVINGLNLVGSHVVMTSLEHNSVIRPLKRLESEGKIELSIVDCDNHANIDPENIRKAMRDNTKLIAVNHCSNVTGAIADVKEIAKIAHESDAYILVDASQSAGNVPIDFDGWDLDFMAFTGHKSLYGIQGTGGLVVKEGTYIKPLKVGGTGIHSSNLFQPEGFPIHYEAGTPNNPGIISLLTGVNWVLETGLDTIAKHKKKLFDRIYSELKDIEGMTCYNLSKQNSFTNFCFNIEHIVPEEVGYILDSSFDILVRTGLHCAPLLLKPIGADPWGTVRASYSYFTTEEEIHVFIDAVKQIASVKR